MANQKKKRNSEIYTLYKTGKTLDYITQKYKISKANAGIIISKEQRFRDNAMEYCKTKEGEIFFRTVTCTNNNIAFNALGKNGINDLDKLLELYNDLPTLFSIRNLGIKSILDMAEKLIKYGYNIDYKSIIEYNKIKK